jgi:hypothetical protein
MKENRRLFVLTGAGVVGLSGCDPVPVAHFPTLKGAREAVLDLLFRSPTHDSPWTLSELLQHLAQSVEYSMSGYPEMKSALFRAIVGNTAFAAFDAVGSMKHGLTEPIPGAPALSPNIVLKHSAQRLIDALAAFEHWNGPLKPHFAYGELDKHQYTRAHLMHLANHWKKLQFPPPPAKTP